MQDRYGTVAPATAPLTRAQHSQAGQPNLVWVPALRDNNHDADRGRHRRDRGISRSSSMPPAALKGDLQSPPRDPRPVYPPTPHPRVSLDATGQPAPTRDAQSHLSQHIMRTQSSAAHHREPRRRSDEYERERRRDEDATGRERYLTSPGMSVGEQHQHMPRRSSLGVEAERHNHGRSLSVSRSFPLPQRGMQRRLSSAQSPTTARAMHRSQTLPAELGNRDQQLSPPPMPMPFLSRNGVDSSRPYQELRPTFSPRIIRTLDHCTPPRSPEYTDADPRSPTEGKSSADRIRNWISETRKWTETPQRDWPQGRRTVDGYEHLGSRAREAAQPREESPLREFFSAEDPVRSSSLPILATRNGNLTTPVSMINDITEEPRDLRRRDSVSSSSTHDFTQPSWSSSRPTLDRNDTIVAVQSSRQISAEPSSQSLNRDGATYYTPSRNVYDRTHEQRESSPYQYLSPSASVGAVHSRHVSPASSGQFRDSPSASAAYNTPPITPVRPQPHYTNSSAEPPTYYGNSSASASRTSVATPGSNNWGPSPLRQVDPVHRTSSAQLSPSSYQPPTRLQYLYQPDSVSPSRHSQPVPSSAPHTPSHPQPPASRAQAPSSHHHSAPRVQQSGQHAYSSAQISHASTPVVSRSPSPLQPSARSNRPSAVQSRQSTPSRSPLIQTSKSLNPSPAPARNYPKGNGSAPHTPSRGSRNARVGFWNRRGDHLTADGFVVYCPPGRNYPSDLAHYPEREFMDHQGKVIHDSPDRHAEHPDSIPKAGRKALKPYDTVSPFVTFYADSGSLT